MHYIHDTWKPTAIAITEFGFSVPFEGMKTIKADILSDLPRRMYYKEYLEGVLIALSEGVPIVGCLAWSLIDNLEWSEGITVKYGMQFVNFSTPTLERSYKASFFEYAHMFSQYLQT